MTETLTLTTPDISCAHCVGRVQDALTALDGVQSAIASEASKQVEIAYDPAVVETAAFYSALDEAGYPALPANKPFLNLRAQ